MVSVTVYNMEGQSVGEIALDPRFFDVKVKPSLVHEVVVSQMANSRSAIAHTKDRGEVAGTGKKPWKQKGTGRARHGSRRSPIWIGGGITFGPRNIRNFSKKVNQKVKRTALAMVLSDKVASSQFVVVDTLALENGKTKELAKSLKQLPISTKKKLIITRAEQKDVARAARNLPHVTTLPVHSLNVVDILRYGSLVISKDALEELPKLYRRTISIV